MPSIQGAVHFFLTKLVFPTKFFVGQGLCGKRQIPLLVYLWLKFLEISLPLAAGSSSETSLSEPQEAEGNSVSGPLDVWSVSLMDGQLVTGTSYRFLHRSE